MHFALTTLQLQNFVRNSSSASFDENMKGLCGIRNPLSLLFELKLIVLVLSLDTFISIVDLVAIRDFLAPLFFFWAQSVSQFQFTLVPPHYYLVVHCYGHHLFLHFYQRNYS